MKIEITMLAGGEAYVSRVVDVKVDNDPQHALQEALRELDRKAFRDRFLEYEAKGDLEVRLRVLPVDAAAE